MVCFRGHSANWDSRNIYERSGYRDQPEELTGWALKIRHLARQAGTAHVLFSQLLPPLRQTNARRLASLLSHDACHLTNIRPGQQRWLTSGSRRPIVMVT